MAKSPVSSRSSAPHREGWAAMRAVELSGTPARRLSSVKDNRRWTSSKGSEQ
jgi:hypothetical protein